jgi:CheY-like chemotaxis protein
MDTITSTFLSAPNARNAGTRRSIMRVRILVVIGDTERRNALIRTLESLNPIWHINEACHSEQALMKLKAVQGKFDVIIVDADMGGGGLEGYEFVQYVRSALRVSSFIIGLSKGEAGQAQVLRTAGANEIWGEPHPSPEEIKAIIDKAVSESVARGRRSINGSLAQTGYSTSSMAFAKENPGWTSHEQISESPIDPKSRPVPVPVESSRDDSVQILSSDETETYTSASMSSEISLGSSFSATVKLNVIQI